MIGSSNSSSGYGFIAGEALLIVYAPAGSTVAITNGNTTKRQKSSSGHPTDDNTVNAYFFPIRSSNYGSWTITAELEGIITTGYIFINVACQYEYWMDLGIYHNGNVNSSIAGGLVQDFTFSKFNTYNVYKGNASLENDHILFDLTQYPQSQEFMYQEINTNNAIDLTNYSNIAFDYEIVSRNYAAYIGIFSGKSNYYINDDRFGPAYYRLNNSVGTYTNAKLDISSISGSYYITIWDYYGGSSDVHGTLKVNRIILER